VIAAFEEAQSSKGKKSRGRGGKARQPAFSA
jgi:hypothetical protein